MYAMKNIYVHVALGDLFEKQGKTGRELPVLPYIVTENEHMWNDALCAVSRVDAKG